MTEHGFEQMRRAGTGSRLRFLAKDSLLYGLALAASRLVTLALFPILARYFATAEYGVVDAINIFGSLAAFLLIVGQDSAVARFFYEVESETERRQVITQALVIQLCSSAVICLFLVLGANVLTRGWLTSNEFREAYLFQVLSLPALMLGNFCQNLLKWTFVRRSFMIISFGSVAATAGFSVVFAVGLGLGVRGVFLGTLLARVLAATYGLRTHRSRLVQQFVHDQEGRLALEFLLAYAPELNPVEYLWGHWKNHELSNFCPKTFSELSDQAWRALQRMKGRPRLVTAFWKQARLFD